MLNGAVWEPKCDTVCDKVKAVAVGSDSTIVVTTMLEIKEYKDGAWSLIAGRANDVAVGPEGALFIISTTTPNSIKKLINGSFVDVLSAPSNPQRIEVDKFDELWIMNSKGEIYS